VTCRDAEEDGFEIDADVSLWGVAETAATARAGTHLGMGTPSPWGLMTLYGCSHYCAGSRSDSLCAEFVCLSVVDSVDGWLSYRRSRCCGFELSKADCQSECASFLLEGD
jgi:hypothetical protein